VTLVSWFAGAPDREIDVTRQFLWIAARQIWEPVVRMSAMGGVGTEES